MCYAFFNTFVFFVYKSLLFTLEKCLKADFACACLVAKCRDSEKTDVFNFIPYETDTPSVFFRLRQKQLLFYSLRTVINTLSKKLLQLVLFDERSNNCWVVFEQQNTANEVSVIFLRKNAKIFVKLLRIVHCMEMKTYGRTLNAFWQQSKISNEFVADNCKAGSVESNPKGVFKTVGDLSPF